MWAADPTKLVKVLMHTQGEDVETPWAEDEGPASSPPGARRVRLANVPFLHAKPTYGDLIVAAPDPAHQGVLSWDNGGLPHERIKERIAEDGGRWTMIVDYFGSSPAVDVQSAFSVLAVSIEKANMVLEVLYSPKEGRPGRAYLAVPYELSVADVLERLRGMDLPLTLTLVHPVDD